MVQPISQSAVVAPRTTSTITWTPTQHEIAQLKADRWVAPDYDLGVRSSKSLRTRQ